MNKIVNKFLLAGDKFMPEMHLKQPDFTYSGCGPFTKTKDRIQTFMQTGNTDYIYKNDLDKASFQNDMAYGKYKNLAKRKESDKVLKDKAFKIAGNRNYDGYQRGLASMVYKFFNKNLQVVVPLRLQINLLNLSQNNNLQMNFINQLLKNLKDEEFINHLKTIFGV